MEAHLCEGVELGESEQHVEDDGVVGGGEQSLDDWHNALVAGQHNVEQKTGHSYLENVFIHPCRHLLQVGHVVAKAPDCVMSVGRHLAESAQRLASETVDNM